MNPEVLALLFLGLPVLGLAIAIRIARGPVKVNKSSTIKLNIGKSRVEVIFQDGSSTGWEFIGETKLFNTVWSSKNKAQAFVDCNDPLWVGTSPDRFIPRSYVAEYIVTHEDHWVEEYIEKWEPF